jgi:hypothetical protein
VRDFRTAIHRDLGGGAKLALQLSDDEKTHGSIPYDCRI